MPDLTPDDELAYLRDLGRQMRERSAGRLGSPDTYSLTGRQLEALAGGYLDAREALRLQARCTAAGSGDFGDEWPEYLVPKARACLPEHNKEGA